MIKDYKIIFAKDNSNSLLFYKNDKLVNFITLPPINNGCDILTLSKEIHNGYNHNTDSLVLITSPSERTLYYKGNIITQTKR